MPKRDKNILTKIQRETLESIKRFIYKHGHSPSISELSDILGLKSPTVVDRVNALCRKGFILKTPHKWRNLKLVKDSVSETSNFIQIPLVASVGADNLSVFAEQEYGHYLRVEEKLLKGHRNVFIVRTMGNSMRDANIYDGDYVLAEEITLGEVKTGDIVIAVIEDKTVVKEIEFGKNAIIFHPKNKSKNYQPIIVDKNSENFKVVGLFIDILPFAQNKEDDISFEKIVN